MKYVGGRLGPGVPVITDVNVPPGIYSQYDQYYAVSQGSWHKRQFLATGGNFVLEPGNGYRYHTFTSPGTFVAGGELPSSGCEVLVVGGGGGGGQDDGGGGGGGAVWMDSVTIPGTSGNYSISIGSGGNAARKGAPVQAPSFIQAGQGGSSSFSGPAHSRTAPGGGYGSSEGAPTPMRGGQPSSGGAGAGGGNGGFGSRPGGSSSGPGGGNGQGPASPYGGGGGGGGGPQGQPGGPPGATGGAGTQYTQFEGTLIGIPELAPQNGYFGGGGGGMRNAGATPLGGGGRYGGPQTYPEPPASPSNRARGWNNSGGGGNGGPDGSQMGNSGGPGIVVVRYLYDPSQP